jgi:hypothetical protein
MYVNSKMAPPVHAPAPVPSLRNKFDAALHVKDVKKDTICMWYMTLFYIFAAVYVVQIVGLLAALPRMSMIWILIPVLLGDIVVLANLYFYTAMCEKLPEGFIGSVAAAAAQPKSA